MSRRLNARQPSELRKIQFSAGYTQHAEGSVLAEFGATRVLCTASIDNTVPGFLKGSGSGWITGEYGMLPRATHTRFRREATRSQQEGRTLEIQRMIGRSLRATADLKALGRRTVTLDCDVLQADGGTRTASISGAYIALRIAMDALMASGELVRNPVHGQIAAVSVGICGGVPALDLDYAEDAKAETDMNVVMNDAGAIVEIQGTAEGHAFRRDELDQLLDLAAVGIRTIMEEQNRSLDDWRSAS